MKRLCEYRLIQGGMGFLVSGYHLARAVSRTGRAIGTVSGVALDVALVKLIRDGLSRELRLALAAFPDQTLVGRVLGHWSDKRVAVYPFTISPAKADTPEWGRWRMLVETTILANYAWVWLAKHDQNGRPHSGKVAVNYLTHISLPVIFALYGAMLAGVDVVIMGAGIPRQVPKVLDALAIHQPVKYQIEVAGALKDDVFYTSLDPNDFLPPSLQSPLRRPDFLAIVSSATLASYLYKSGGVQGFVVEHHTAGGHNAPPRPLKAGMVAGPTGYSQRDELTLQDFQTIQNLGLPFWLAGGRASPQGLAEARRLGAVGVQVGTAFALSQESGMLPKYKRAVSRGIYLGTARIATDHQASPTGYPFKVFGMVGTVSELEVYEARQRRCVVSVLRVPCWDAEHQRILYRCPSEQVSVYQKKGGNPEDTQGKKCVCEGLLETVGFAEAGQPALITIGDNQHNRRILRQLMRHPGSQYPAEQVVDYILQPRHGKKQKRR